MIPCSFINKQSLRSKIRHQEIQYGQILIVTKKPNSDPLDPDLDIDIELITESLDDLKANYGVKVPTSGVELPEKVKKLLDEIKEKDCNNSLIALQRYYQYRQLLIARKMSQLVAKT